MRRRWRFMVTMIVALGLTACAAAPKPPPEPAAVPVPAPQSEQPSFTQLGIASWYGKTHDGHQTANGEIFDMQAMTAAHKTLPFGSVVRVTNLANGRMVKVRINDRGPYVAGRIIDLSERAAHELAIGDNGAVKVKIERYTSDQPGS